MKTYNVKSYKERFENKYIPITESGCWIWLDSLDHAGYGRLRVREKKRLAHRVAYEIHRGDIPNNLPLDHLCRVRCCVNPWHLEAVSPAENIRRGETGKHQLLRTHCPQGHLYDGINTRLNNGSRQCRECDKIRARRKRKFIKNQFLMEGK